MCAMNPHLVGAASALQRAVGPTGSPTKPTFRGSQPWEEMCHCGVDIQVKHSKMKLNSPMRHSPHWAPTPLLSLMTCIGSRMKMSCKR